MSTFRRLALVPVIALLVASLSSQGQDKKDPDNDFEKKKTEKNAGDQALPKLRIPADEKEAADILTKAERALVDAKDQFKKGGVSALELDLAAIIVNEAKLRVAVLRDRDEDIVPNLKEIVSTRERILKRMSREPAPRGETAANVDIATRLLAESRLRLARAQADDQEMIKQLEQIVSVARRELTRTESLVNSRSATQQELEAAKKVLDDARKRLAELKGM